MEENKKFISEFAIASLALGIISFVQLAGYEKSILAVVFGILALNRIRKSDNTKGGRKTSIAGITLGLGSIAITTAFLYIYFGGL